nr:hypothetical protein Iba_chr04aCG16800 [Ipomoea batatas]GMC91206.1 hypothetical protein Iba_chr04fCG15190 [Ipomoea batatas]
MRKITTSAVIRRKRKPQSTPNPESKKSVEIRRSDAKFKEKNKSPGGWWFTSMELLTCFVDVLVVARWENWRRLLLTLLNRRSSPAVKSWSWRVDCRM